MKRYRLLFILQFAAVDSMENRVTLLGVRGSIPVSGEAYQGYGCATTCYLIELEGEIILVDAGNGILNYPHELLDRPVITMLLTHPHMDHLIGLPMYQYLFRKGATLHLYAAVRGGMDAKSQVNALLAPPLWPIGVGSLPAALICRTLPESVPVNGVLVEWMEGEHPGGVAIFRITGGGKRIVIATDCTINDNNRTALTKFAEGCDLLLCDGQYSEEEWPAHATFGHSTWTSAASLARDAGAKQTRIVHHDPAHNDAFLDDSAASLQLICPGCAFAREGEVIHL